jgi:acyl-coenzyme A thioesterase PaaI-like protein
MNVRDQHLDYYGHDERSKIVGLIDRAWSAAALGDLNRGAQLISLTANFHRSSRARELIADATLQPIAGTTAFGSVEVRRQSETH